MATYDYSGITATALRLLQKFGTICTLVRKGSSGGWTYEYDSVEMRYYWEDGEGTVVYIEPSEAVIEDEGVGVITSFDASEIDGETIKQTDVKLVLMNTIEPMLSDTFIIGGISYKYVSHKNIAPDGNIILYMVQVRI